MSAMDVDRLAQIMIDAHNDIHGFARTVISRGERIRELASERDALRAALARASDYVEIISGACPFDAVPEYECPHQEECSNEMATCWREYFMSKAPKSGEVSEWATI